MKKFSEMLLRMRNSRELSQEEKNFERIYKDCEQLRILMRSGILKQNVIDLLLRVKKQIEKSGQYGRMDRIISEMYPGRRSATITNLMGRIAYELIFLRYGDRENEVVLIPSRCRELLSMMEELKEEKELYDKSVEKLKRLEENLSIISL